MWETVAWYILMGLLNALWIVGVWNACLPGQILDPIAAWMAGDSRAMPPIEANLPSWVTKPLFECPMCAASIHGIAWWLLFCEGPLFLMPVYVVTLSGFMKLVSILVLDKDQ